MSPRRDPDAIEGHLHRLRTRPWPPATDPRVEEVLDELRDHLLSDVEQQVALGADERSATTRALADLGPLDTLATALRRELIRPRLRRLSRTLLALLLAAAAGWKAVLLFGPAEPWTERAEPGPLALLDETGEWAGAAALLAALLAVALVARSGRGLPDRPRVAGQRWSLRACWAGIALWRLHRRPSRRIPCAPRGARAGVAALAGSVGGGDVDRGRRATVLVHPARRGRARLALGACLRNTPFGGPGARSGSPGESRGVGRAV
jgi:hypothetical protein